MGKGKIDPAELQGLLEILERIQGIDLGKLAEEQMEPMDKLISQLESDSGLRRGKRGLDKKKRRPKQSWQAKRRKRRQYYRDKLKPRKQAKLRAELKTPEGWYPYINRKWKERELEFFTLDQWVGVIWPCLNGRVPVFGRYDRTKGFTLENVVVRDDKTGDVLFDGIEYRMRRLGYIL